MAIWAPNNGHGSHPEDGRAFVFLRNRTFRRLLPSTQFRLSLVLVKLLATSALTRYGMFIAAINPPTVSGVYVLR